MTWKPTVADYLSAAPSDEETARRAVEPYREMSTRERLAALTDLLRSTDVLLDGRMPARSPDDEAFFTLLRTYTAEFKDGNATTADFIRLAEEISGQDLQEFFEVRLYEPL